MASSFFSNLEYIDGYFSGTMQLDCGGDRFVFEFGYDAEFRNLELYNCRKLSRGFHTEAYKSFSATELRDEFGDIIMEEILYRFHSNYGRYMSFEEYEAQDFEDDYEF